MVRDTDHSPEAGVLNTALRIGVEDWALRADRSAGPSFAET
ncbi:hypothetical protein ABZ927_06690 [Streptomyces massasporeus]